jgi:two-component system sensor histidine kinase DctS
MPLVTLQARKLGVRVDTRIASRLQPVLVDRTMVEQVVLNLARNGIEAMADAPADRRELEVRTEAREGKVTLSVADHGSGVAPDVARKLFSPFFTTKAAGMGMGLTICRSIVELHSGRLWFEANAGAGTVFSFSLPVDTP